MVLTDAGYVGIGTNNPSNTLNVFGSVKIDLSSETNNILEVQSISDNSALDANHTTGGCDQGMGDKWQSFTVINTGKIHTVEVLIGTNNANVGTLYLYEGTGTGGTLLTSEPYNMPAQGGSRWKTINLSSGTILNTGHTYTIRLSNAQWKIDCGGNTYPGGQGEAGNNDHPFKIYLYTPGTGLVYNTDGYLGVGIDNPSETLHVKGNILMDDGNQQAGYIMTSDADGIASWSDYNTLSHWTENGGNLYRNSGNIGIGLTSPNHLLSLPDGENYISLGENIFINGQNSSGRISNNAYIGGGGWQNADGSNKASTIEIRDDGSIELYGALTDGGVDWQKMFGVDAPNNISYFPSGFVGIGTESPSSKLEISDDPGTDVLSALKLYKQDPDGDINENWRTSIDFKMTDSNTSNPAYPQASIALSPGIGMSGYAQESSGALIFSTALGTGQNTNTLTERLVIDQNGNVGIGTITPSEKLHIDGNIRMEDGNQQNGYVMTSDANGTASWQEIPDNVQDKMVLSSSIAMSEDDVSSSSLSDYGSLTGDDPTVVVTLPFSVNLGGNAYTSLYISGNGWVEFTNSSSSDYSNDCLPTSAHTDPFVAAYWDDLNTPTANGIEYGFVGSSPNRVFIVSYDCQTLAGAYDIDFQIQIHETSNLINVKYFNINPNAAGQEATIGYQGAGGSSATAYPISCNGRILDDNTDDGDPASDSWSVCPVR